MTYNLNGVNLLWLSVSGYTLYQQSAGSAARRTPLSSSSYLHTAVCPHWLLSTDRHIKQVILDNMRAVFVHSMDSGLEKYTKHSVEVIFS